MIVAIVHRITIMSPNLVVTHALFLSFPDYYFFLILSNIQNHPNHDFYFLLNIAFTHYLP